MNETDGVDVAQKIPVDALVAINRAEVDMQVVTAKRHPRNIKDFKAQAKELATQDEETASGCFYVLKRGGKKIEGPSVRLAEIVASAWGNLRIEARIGNDDGRFIDAEAVAWDLEKNVAVKRSVRRRITNREGQRYSDDMVGVTANAASSIALRNAIFAVVPRALTKDIYRAAVAVAIGDADTLVDRRQKMMAHFAKMGIDEKQVLGLVEQPSVDDIGLDDLALLKGVATAIRDSDTTVDQAFAKVPKDLPKANGSKQQFGFPANGNGEATATEPAPEASVAERRKGLRAKIKVLYNYIKGDERDGALQDAGVTYNQIELMAKIDALQELHDRLAMLYKIEKQTDQPPTPQLPDFDESIK